MVVVVAGAFIIERATEMIWSHRHRPVHWTEFVFLGVILFIVLLFMRGCDPAQAEWVTIEKFGGVNTDASATQIPMGDARYAVGVYTRGGRLLNGDYMRHTGQSYVSKEPCNVLSRMADKNGIIFDNGWLQWYDASGDSSYILEDTTTTVTDSCTGVRVTGDAGWVGAPGDMLSRFAGDTALAKFNLSQISSLRLKPTGGGAEIIVPISAIYSEKYLRLRDTGSIVNGTKYFWKTFGTVLGKNNTGALQYTDTVLFLNGQQMTTLSTRDILKDATHIMASPPDTGDISYVSALLVDTIYGQLRLKGTTATFSRSDVGKYMYFQDTSLVYTGQIARIQKFDTSATNVFLRVCADTALRNRVLARYAALPIRVQIFSKPQGERVLSAWAQNIGAVDSMSILYLPCTTSTYSYQLYVNITATQIFGPVYGPLIAANPRCDDNAFWEWWAGQQCIGCPSPYYPKSFRVIPIRKVGGSSTKVRVLIVRDSLFPGTAGAGTVQFYGGEVRRWSTGFAATLDTVGLNSKRFHWTVAENHRGRVFYTGNKMKTPWDSTVIYAWSPLDHYDVVTGLGSGIERLEGDAAIVGLSSMGSNLLIYRNRPPNAILSQSGFSDEDFFLTPLSAGVGAVSDQSIARNPLDEADYFPNNLGMWKCDGSSVSKVQTNCEAIFRDSINWAAENMIVGAVFDNHYWLAAPFGTSTVNDRFLAIDLESGAVTFVPNYSTWYPGSLKVLRLPGFRDRMFAGASDTGKMFEIAPPGTHKENRASTDDLWNMTAQNGEWRSGWMDFGEPTIRKRINAYNIVYQSDQWSSSFGSLGGEGRDWVIVSFYKDYSETAVWSDSITSNTFGTDTTTISTMRMVPGVVQGRSLSFGIRFSGQGFVGSVVNATGDVSVSKFAMDVVSVGTVKPR